MPFGVVPVGRAAWLLPYLAGVLSTVVGSWVASKIRAYQENRKSHHEELKERILSPILRALENSYSPLVECRVPAASIEWGKRTTLHDTRMTQGPEIYGSVLKIEDPGLTIERGLNEALLLDATQTHYRKLIDSWEQFRARWTSHSQSCGAWVSNVAIQILKESGLAAHPQPYGEPCVMHLDLAVLVYHRLFDIPTETLSKEPQGERCWLKGSRGATVAVASEREIDELLTVLENVRESQRLAAQELRKEAEGLGAALKPLHRDLSFAIAEKRFRRTCTMVPFF